MQAHEVRAQPRYAVFMHVDLVTARADLMTLPMTNLSFGGAFLSTPTPEEPGSDVALLIQPAPRGPSAALALSGRVVHTRAEGMGIQFVASSGSGAALLDEFVARVARDTATAEAAALGGPPLGKVLAAARMLFQGIEVHDPFAAIGMPATASPEEIAQRLVSLARVFSADRPDATPPQRARLDSALRAVARLETQLAERVAALRHQAELVIRTRSQQQLRLLADDAAREEKRGDLVAARRLLVQALAIAPHEEAAAPVRAAITRITDNLDASRAREILNSAEVFVDGVGMREDALRLSREAVRLSAVRDVRLRALRVLAKAGEADEAIGIARELISENGNDPLALQALVHLHERAGRFALALRAARQLLSQRPDDPELADRVERLDARVKKDTRFRR